MTEPGGAGAAGGRRIYLHVGLQKTGTTYLQDIFWQSRDELAAQGLDLVPGSRRATFDLMLDVRRRVDATYDRPAAADALARLRGQLAAAPGDRALLSEEALAEAWDPRIRALLAACGDREVHVVMTLRDLGRQIPSAWQQMIQTGGSVSFEDYLARLRRREARDDFWANKDLVELLGRWSVHVPAPRVHLVTVPPAGGDPSLLLHRYCAVLGVDAARLDTRLDWHNPSLGRVEAEVARRVNARLDASHRQRDVYGDVGKRFFAVQVLGAQPGRRISVPTADRDWVLEVSRQFADHLRSGGYDVAGDPDDLLPSAGAFGDPDEGRPTEQEVADAATAALAAVLSDRMDRLRRRRAADRARRAAAASPAPEPPRTGQGRSLVRRTTRGAPAAVRRAASAVRARIGRHRD